uniref:Cytochrome P450 4g1 n=2 Tax=Cacopsylla melanoneura TaxID=428564 RepID=A0A8D9F3W7_9HEMI
MLLNPEVSMDELILQGATIITAGIDTTKSQNILLLLMLALHPDVQNNVYNELASILDEDITQVPSYEAVSSLNYLDRVIKETLRMFPVAPVLARQAYRELTVMADDGEYTIPAGTVLLTMVTDIHNNPHYYDNPHLFNPDRWLPDHHPYSNHAHCYLPFSNGPRNCLGYKYALLQMKLLIVNLVRSYEILPTETCQSLEDVRFDMSITLKLEDTCRVRFKTRRTL